MTHVWNHIPVLPPEKMVQVEDYVGTVCPEDYEVPSWELTETDALIFYCYVKNDADGLVAALGGVQAFLSEARRYREWLVQDELPETLTVFQGGREGHPSVSWTTSRKIAELFADDLSKTQSGAREVRTMTVHRDDVVMAYPNDIELEIIHEGGHGRAS